MNKQVFDKPNPRYFTILRCRVGSRAYGTATPESDEDFKGIYIPPINQLLGIEHEKKTLRFSEDDQSYSLKHYCQLCSKCQPNVLELLFCEDEDVVTSTSEGRMLRRSRDLFLSKKCVAPYLGYAEAQMQACVKFPQGRGVGRKELMAKFGYDTKFAYHTIRLLQTADDLLTTGVLKVRRPNPEFLMDIRRGKAFSCYDDFRNFALRLSARIRDLEDKAELPDGPNLDEINRLMITIQWRIRSSDVLGLKG